MEIKIRSGLKSKKIDIEKSILSIQDSDDDTINNLREDYEVVVIDNLDDYFIGKTVIDEITLYSKYPELTIVSDVMQLLGLSREFFDKKVRDLSRTEKIYLNLLRNIAKIDEIVLFLDVYLGLDQSNRKKLKSVLNYLKASHLVIICSSDVNDLYDLADYSIIANKTSLKYSATDDIYTDVSTLLKYKLDVPTLPYITYKAKEEKNVKLFYSKDVRDIIKDIYKHV